MGWEREWEGWIGMEGKVGQAVNIQGETGDTTKNWHTKTYLTSRSIQTWALEEARRRLEAEGILADPDVKKD